MRFGALQVGGASQFRLAAQGDIGWKLHATSLAALLKRPRPRVTWGESLSLLTTIQWVGSLGVPELWVYLLTYGD